MKLRSTLAFVAFFHLAFAAFAATSRPAGISKVGDVVIYADARFHAAFPSIVRRADGELIVAFRRAPDRRRLGDERYTHADPNSYLMLVRSRDDGRTWTSPQLFFAHPFGGSQDPCLVQLSDQSLLCASYGWAWMPSTALPKLPQPNTVHEGKFVFLGGWLLRSTDGAKTWSAPIMPPRAQGEERVDIFGAPLPAFNRGALCEGADGRLYWAVAVQAPNPPSRTEVHLMISSDKGTTWQDSAVIARDPKATFNETSMYETPSGELIAFLRTAGLNDHLCIARSKDHGRTFAPWEEVGFQGHPFHVTRLPDGRALLVYGYRHPPYGIRARVLDPECIDLLGAPEVVLRDDGGAIDLGYPWATVLGKDRALVVYYFNQADGPRTIAGTFLKLE